MSLSLFVCLSLFKSRSSVLSFSNTEKVATDIVSKEFSHFKSLKIHVSITGKLENRLLLHDRFLVF